jgi:tRNA-dependent cyclodipeptide synthase
MCCNAPAPLISDANPEHAPSPTRYRAKIDCVSPAARRETFEQHEECFLGVSLENSNFVRPKLTGILEWIARRFPRCTVLIGDSIHRITLETMRGVSPEVALAGALQLGREFLEQERGLFDRFGGAARFSFVTCSEIQTWPAYATFHDQLVELYQRDEKFRDSVESFGQHYIRKHSSGISDAEHIRRVERSSEYFLEEFAIFACLRQRNIEVMVYPGSFSTMAEIASGEHPAAPEELRQMVVVSLNLRGR